MTMDARRRKPKISESNTDQAVGEVRPIAVLSPDPKNARRMSVQARAGLAVSLKTFGPLDVVFNIQSGQLVSGHMRIAELKAAGATDITMLPGQSEWGYVVHPGTGARFWVRFVDWDTTKQRIANLVANSPELQGEFTPEAVDQARAVQGAAEAEGLHLDLLLQQLERDLEGAGKHDPSGLEDFVLDAPPKKAWILIATSSDRLPDIEAALRPFEDADTRIEISNV